MTKATVEFLSGYDFWNIAMEASLALNNIRPCRNDEHFNFFSINGKEICITFNNCDSGIVMIFEGGDANLLYSGSPQYLKIEAPWGGLGRIQLSKESRKAIDDATGNDLISGYVESAIMRYLEKR